MELSLGRASWYAGRLLCLKTLLAVSTAQVFAQDAAKPAPERSEIVRRVTHEIGRAHV